MKKITIISFLYIVIILFLFFYSYSQVDLSLTLSRASVFQYVEKLFQYVGYFNRPLSSVFYILLLLFLYGFYIVFLILADKKVISLKFLWTIIILTAGILTFSYNAFSYDLFNYIFDAKIVTHYHVNPYFYRALDFPHDPMLSFMHWTQRTYPYGPLWLFLTVPLSFIGFQYFLVTFFLFKTFIALCYVGCVYFLLKILQRIKPSEAMFGTMLFALNPLVLIEALVSAHNDITMMFFSILALWYLLEKKSFVSYMALLISVGTKFATVFLLPVFVFISFLFRKNKKIDWQFVFLLCSIFMIIPIILASMRTNFQPWYLLYVLPFTALVGKKYYGIIPSIIMSFFSLLQYVPFLYTGNWNSPIPSILFWLNFLGIMLSGLIMAFYFLITKLAKRNK